MAHSPHLAMLGFNHALVKRVAMILNDGKAGTTFFVQANPRQSPCDFAVVDWHVPEALVELQELRKLWPTMLVISISDQGQDGDTPYHLPRAQLFTGLHALLIAAIADSAIVGGQKADHKIVPRADAILPTGALCALLVDDSNAVRLQLSGALQRIGIRAEESASGEHALAKVKLKQYDFFIVDVRMPNMDGHTFAKRLREFEAYKKTPIIVLTAQRSTMERVRSTLAGADLHLSKPINMKDFFIALDKVLTKQWPREVLLQRGYRQAQKPIDSRV